MRRSDVRVLVDEGAGVVDLVVDYDVEVLWGEMVSLGTCTAPIRQHRSGLDDGTLLRTDSRGHLSSSPKIEVAHLLFLVLRDVGVGELGVRHLGQRFVWRKTGVKEGRKGSTAKERIKKFFDRTRWRELCAVVDRKFVRSKSRTFGPDSCRDL